jgi:hypothetical protein
MKIWTVIGRIDGHDNVLLYIHALTCNSAAQRFRRILWAGSDKHESFSNTEFHMEAIFEGRQLLLSGDLLWAYSS